MKTLECRCSNYDLKRGVICNKLLFKGKLDGTLDYESICPKCRMITQIKIAQ